MNFPKFIRFSLIFFVSVLSLQGLAQDEHQHTRSSETDTATQDSMGILDEITPPEEAVPATKESEFASLDEFPNLHPFVVHFPIVLLLLAFLSQLLGLFALREKFSWITLFLLLAGFVGAVLAAEVFHAHVGELPQNILNVYESHEYYGKATTWLAGIALVLKIISHFWLKRKTWAEIIVFLVITGSALTVSLAGHLGSQMVHIENVGPQGNYLEEHEH